MPPPSIVELLERSGRSVNPFEVLSDLPSEPASDSEEDERAQTKTDLVSVHDEVSSKRIASQGAVSSSNSMDDADTATPNATTSSMKQLGFSKAIDARPPSAFAVHATHILGYRPISTEDGLHLSKPQGQSGREAHSSSNLGGRPVSTEDGFYLSKEHSQRGRQDRAESSPQGRGVSKLDGRHTRTNVCKTATQENQSEVPEGTRTNTPVVVEGPEDHTTEIIDEKAHSKNSSKIEDCEDSARCPLQNSLSLSSPSSEEVTSQLQDLQMKKCQHGDMLLEESWTMVSEQDVENKDTQIGERNARAETRPNCCTMM
ncbi:hypothetical protein K491DRAFT_711006 [Lophiostoma macrostomum CBS 122681]|uniref:Uncharacterized protein n=1 Tax=Lophiostoma macrostomum CBS 122681 TaxID=1314788 RepID=A0A6A6TNQ4_9PLEO|nr:hypothetical protein K491DRAFT_711006 [Lophiostoma macrostomum CBS 122681]